MVNQGLSEAQRENIYWWISAALLLSTPLLIIDVAMDYPILMLRFESHIPGIKYMLFLGVGAIVAAMLFEMFLSTEPKVWIKRPSVTVEYPIHGDLEQWIKRHFRLLDVTGFAYSYSTHEGGRQWQINKKKDGFAQGFADHAFSGAVTVTEDSFGTKASMSLTFEDIVVIETGEYFKLNQLARRLLGEEGSDIAKELPLTLCSAVILGVATHAFFYGEQIFDLRLPGFAAAFLASGEAVWMMITIIIKPRELIGLRIAVAMIIAGGAPFIALAIGKLFLSG